VGAVSASLTGVRADVRSSIESLSRLVGRYGGVLTITSGYRSAAYQARLYRDYLSGVRGLYNVAPPGHSAHEQGRAVDLVINPEWMLYAAGQLWEQYGGVWGGPSDPVHFELR
jgi:LAS superfamily LD-carboxypeptidase LdcB